jgi:hypothetical protein
LDGLEAALELERELGRRTLEIDRSLLIAPAREQVAQARPEVVKPPSSPLPSSPLPSSPSSPPPSSRTTPKTAAAAAESACERYDFVFLHHEALTPPGIETMGKIVNAMNQTADTAPVLFTGALPRAKVYVVLGSTALKKWFPGAYAAPGQWISDDAARNILVTYSPLDILRFPVVTPAVKKIKQDMWNCLKAVMQRVAL